jgi:aspartyl protease family protein
MMADTGATVVSLSAEDARQIGINSQSLQFTGTAQTANGTVRKAPITLPELPSRDSCCATFPLLVALQVSVCWECPRLSGSVSK